MEAVNISKRSIQVARGLVGRGKGGSGTAGSDQAGSDQGGSDKVGSGKGLLQPTRSRIWAPLRIIALSVVFSAPIAAQASDALVGALLGAGAGALPE